MDNQNNYENTENYVQPSEDYEKKAKTVFILGLVGLIAGVVIGFCCCAIVGPVMGIITLVKASKLTAVLPNLSPEAQNNVKVGKILGIIAIAVGAVFLVINLISLPNAMEQYQQILEQYMALM